MSEPRNPEEPRNPDEPSAAQPRDPGGPRTGRELTPRPSPEESVERFAAPETAHTVGLTEERGAGIVRQSGNARFFAMIATLLIVLFIPVYWLYEQGAPALGIPSRQAAEASAQQVTAIQLGNYLFVANCARCHGPNGQGGIGPPLNDQGKLYQALLPSGQAGPGHLNPNYITTVLTVGGRYVCGDPNSLMPIWSNVNGGPLNYQQIAELVAFITASKDLSWTYQPAAVPGASAPPVETHQGWRDPNYKPPPGATPVPACWRNPSGQIGGGGAAPASSAPVAIASPGTAASPRVVKLDETAQLTIAGPDGKEVSTIPVKKGETVRFEVTNTAGFAHNFYVGAVTDLQAANKANLKGIPDFSSGTQTLDVTFDQAAGNLGFGCLIPGHYPTMHGTIQVVP